MSPWLLLSYLGVQVALGWWVSRRLVSEADYLAAGRRLGTPWLTGSLFATWFGAETCLGASGAIYERGLSGGRADPLGYALCLLLLGLLLAAPLWRSGALTLGDLLRDRFGVGVERLGVLVLVPSSLLWAAAQVRAFGQVVSATWEIDAASAVYLAAILVTAYTALGGLLGDVITDLFQGVIVAVSLLGLLALALGELGGPAQAWASIPAARWSLVPDAESLWQQVDRWSVPVLGSLVTQELTARVVAARSARVARRSALLAAGVYLVVGACPVLLGLLGPALVPGLSEPEELLPRLAAQLLPGAWGALFACALVSAILSTIDSVLLACAALLSRNLVAPLLRLSTDRARLRSARALVVLCAALALVVALHAPGVYELVEAASGLGTAGVLVVTCAALGGVRLSPLAATGALLVGLVAMPAAELAGLAAPFLAAVGAASLTYLTLAWSRPVPLRAAECAADERPG